jgi:hypothetical protein
METSTLSHPEEATISPANGTVLGGLRFRALLVGIPLLLLICLLSVFGDMITKSVQLGVLQIAPPAVIALFVLVLANLLMGKLLKRELLNHSDLIIVYAMLLVGVLVSTRGLIEKLIPPLAYLPYYATPANKLNELITQHLPAWALPFSPAVAAGNVPPVIAHYYEGLPAGAPIPWSVWIGPVLAWFSLAALVIFVFACLATLLRRQWMDNEQLRFPLTILPLALVRNEAEGEPFFSNKLMWWGFALAAVVFLINGLSSNYPDWPRFVIDLKLNALFTERPWNAMGPITLYVSFAAIGFAYFLPTDMLFSVWFFFLLTRYQDILTVQFGGVPVGIGTHDARVFNSFQAAGAYLVIVLVQLRIGWPYFKQVWKTAFSRDKPLDDSNELMSYRTALIGLCAGFGGIILWLAFAGMNPLIAALQMGIYLFIISMIMTRAVSECGWLMTETSFLPTHLIGLFTPLAGLGAVNHSLIAVTNTMFTRDMRGVLFSPFMDIQKLAKETGTRFRSLATPLFLAVTISFVVAATFFIYLAYTRSALTFYAYPNGNAGNMYTRAASDIQGAGWKPDATAYGGFALGIIATTAMVVMRSHFSWFPLNPLAYAIVPSWAGYVLWFPFFLAWILKSMLLKFGGIETYRKLAPFMIGMILGEFTMQILWTLIVMFGHNWSAPGFAIL